VRRENFSRRKGKSIKKGGGRIGEKFLEGRKRALKKRWGEEMCSNSPMRRGG